MAPRRGAETTTSDPEPQIELARLAFNQSLSWRAGQHSIAAGELIRRLERLGLELQDMDQDETDKSSLANVAKDLVTPNLLGHKDKGVRAWTARCLVDVLKICAPDAPFTGTQLRVILPPTCVIAGCANITAGRFYALRAIHLTLYLRSLEHIQQRAQICYRVFG